MHLFNVASKNHRDQCAKDVKVLEKFEFKLDKDREMFNKRDSEDFNKSV